MMYFVALPFLPLQNGGFAPGTAIECPNAAAAIGCAEALSRDTANSGALAFSRQGNTDVGEFEDAVILKAFGEVPEDFGRA